MKSYRQILRSSSIIGGASVISILIGLLRIKVLAVLLGPAGIGLIGILQNLVATASTVAAMGLGTVGTRQIAEAAGRDDQPGLDTARRALFWGTLCMAVLGGILLWALRHVLAEKVLDDPGMAASLGWLALGVTLTVAAGSQGALLNGMRRIADIARLQIYSAALSAALGIGAIWLLGEAGLLLFILAVPLSGFVIGHVYVTRLPKIQLAQASTGALVGQLKTMAKLGAPFMVAGLFGLLGQLVVRTLVQHDLGAVDLGYFQAAWVISMTYLGFVLGAMGTDYYPRLTAAMHDLAHANQLVNEQTEVALLLAGPLLLGMLALAPWIIQLLYSEQFGPAVTILRWQILGDVLKVASWPLGFIIIAAGNGRTFMLTEFTSMTVFVGVTWLALPRFGVEATGIGFLMMYLILLPLVYWLAWRRTQFRWSRSVIRYMTLLVGAAVLVAACGAWSDWLGAVVGLPVAGVFGVMALKGLSQAVDLGGGLSKLREVARRYVSHD